MNAQELLKDLRDRDVRLKADGERLLVDAPPERVTRELREILTRHKPRLLALLRSERVPNKDAERGEGEYTTEGMRDEPTHGRHFDARPSRHPGYTLLYDPVRGEWHDFPTRDCYPSVIELAQGRGDRNAAPGELGSKQLWNDHT